MAQRARKTTPAIDAPASWKNEWLEGAILFLAVVLTYIPIWPAGFSWDDNLVITSNPAIIGPLGLREIWTTSAADICPLTLTTFWFEHALWGLNPLPYHLVNIVLHGLNAILLWRVLRAFAAPGAWLGAALWALHPVQVESAAWIAEMKNTESALFYLLAILFFARNLRQSDAPFWNRNFGLSLLFAALAMAAKSSTVVLPFVFLLCTWWVRQKTRVARCATHRTGFCDGARHRPRLDGHATPLPRLRSPRRRLDSKLAAADRSPRRRHLVLPRETGLALPAHDHLPALADRRGTVDLVSAHGRGDRGARHPMVLSPNLVAALALRLFLFPHRVAPCARPCGQHLLRELIRRRSFSVPRRHGAARADLRRHRQACRADRTRIQAGPDWLRRGHSAFSWSHQLPARLALPKPRKALGQHGAIQSRFVGRL